MVSDVTATKCRQPVFVAASGASSEDTAEDAGVPLSVVLDGETNRSLLDAAMCAEEATAHLPHAIPFGFHGQFGVSPRTGVDGGGRMIREP